MKPPRRSMLMGSPSRPVIAAGSSRISATICCRSAAVGNWSDRIIPRSRVKKPIPRPARRIDRRLSRSPLVKMLRGPCSGQAACRWAARRGSGRRLLDIDGPLAVLGEEDLLEGRLAADEGHQVECRGGLHDRGYRALDVHPQDVVL